MHMGNEPQCDADRFNTRRYITLSTPSHMWQRPVSHPSVNPTVRIQLVLAWASRLTVFLSSPSQASMASSVLKKMIFLDSFREKDESKKKEPRQ